MSECGQIPFQHPGGLVVVQDGQVLFESLPHRGFRRQPGVSDALLLFVRGLRRGIRVGRLVLLGQRVGDQLGGILVFDLLAPELIPFVFIRRPRGVFALPLVRFLCGHVEAVGQEKVHVFHAVAEPLKEHAVHLVREVHVTRAEPVIQVGGLRLEDFNVRREEERVIVVQRI